MDTILGILLGESNNSIRALADLTMCINKYKPSVLAEEMVAELTTSLA